MRKFILSLSVGVLASAGLMAAWCDSNSCANPMESHKWPSPVNIDIGIGYRQDKFDWSIGGFEGVPSVLSELQWKDLRIVQVDGYASYTSCANYAVRVSGDYGNIYHGRNRDADFLGNDKTQPFSISSNNAGKGDVYDIEAGVGYRVTSTCGRFIATPLVGWSYHGQNLHMYDGKQVFDLLAPLEEGPITGLDSSYKTRWFGPWVGMDFSVRVERCAYVFGSFEWHIVSYRGTGRWNLRQDIVGPFHHQAHGFGYIATLGGKWEIWDNWSIGVAGSYRNIRSRHGHERLSLRDPDFGEIDVRLPFNGAKWKSLSVSGIVAYRF